MNKINLKTVFLLVLGILLLPFHAKAGDLSVFVSIAPQKHFVEKIAGDRVDVHIMVPSGATPHTFEPSPGMMKKLARADAYFSIGGTFEKAWRKKIKSANPDIPFFETDRGIQKMPSTERHAHTHDSDNDHLDAPDPHIWLSPPLAMLQARNIFTDLLQIDPAGREQYESNYAAFISEVVALDIKLKKMLSPGTEFMVYHPAWGYFADAYGLKQIAVEIEGKAPKARQVQKLIRHAREKDIHMIMVQPQISSRNAEMIAREIDGRTVVADPLAENWADNLLRIGEVIGKRKDR